MTIDSHSMKEQSIVSVFRSIEQRDGETRNEISAHTGRSVVTVCKMVDLLLEHNLVTEEKNTSSVVGRKAHHLRIRAKAKTILILDITKKRFSARVLYLNCEEAIPRFRYAYEEKISLEENLRSFLNQVRAYAIYENGLEERMIGIGVVVPGPYLKKRDIVINKRLWELSDIKLRALIESCFPEKHIVIEEDVKLAGLHSVGVTGEHKSRTYFYAYIDEGVGGSIIRNGMIDPGAYSFAGDFGQLMISPGKTVEEEIAIPHFFNRLGIQNQEGRSSEQILSELQLDDPMVQEAIEELEKRVALAIYNVCWIVDPNYVVVESKYCRYIPDFIRCISVEIEGMFGEIRKGLLPEVMAAHESVQYAYKGAASMILNQYLISL